MREVKINKINPKPGTERLDPVDAAHHACKLIQILQNYNFSVEGYCSYNKVLASLSERYHPDSIQEIENSVRNMLGDSNDEMPPLPSGLGVKLPDYDRAQIVLSRQFREEDFEGMRTTVDALTSESILDPQQIQTILSGILQVHERLRQAQQENLQHRHDYKNR